ncbi:MAG: hypothetical protein RLZZ21_387 [Planctomycetota bacterium]|jgi:hypothetical protein
MKKVPATIFAKASATLSRPMKMVAGTFFVGVRSCP